MIKLKQLLTEGQVVHPVKMRDITMAALRVVMDIDKEYMIPGGSTHTGEWYDTQTHSFEKQVPWHPKHGAGLTPYFKYTLDPLLFTHFIYSVMFYYRVHMYKVNFKFYYYKYPINSLKKLNPEQLAQLKSSLWHQAFDSDYYKKKDANPMYTLDRDNLKTNISTYPTSDIIKNRHPQTLWSAEIWEYENEPPGGYYDTQVPPEKKIERRLQDYRYSHHGELHWVGIVSGMGIGDLARNIKDAIDKRGGGDDKEKVPEPDPTPKGRKPTLVPA